MPAFQAEGTGDAPGSFGFPALSAVGGMDMTSITLSPDGPHSPGYTREVADAIAEGVRVLNYATRGDGLAYPSDVYDVLGSLSTATHGMDQALRQLQEWVAGQAQAGRVSEHAGGRHRGDTEQALHAFAAGMAEARLRAARLAGALGRAQAEISGLQGNPR